jgi:DNA-binding transcriptional ArsR family regulator
MVQARAADQVFHALSNPTRREVLERLSVGPATVSELAAPFDMQLPSFVQHLERLKVAEDWLTERRRSWEARLNRFDEYVKQLKEKESAS